MKSIKEIENMSLEELIAVSSDEATAVPEGFAERIGRQVEAQKIARARLKLEERKAKREEMAADNAGGKQKVELVIRREDEEEDEQIERIKRICTDPEAEA